MGRHMSKAWIDESQKMKKSQSLGFPEMCDVIQNMPVLKIMKFCQVPTIFNGFPF